MIPNPITRALSIFQKNRVQFLLMGGQACVLYGAAEFSRDMDVALLAETENLENLQNALTELQAEVIAIPPFDERLLERGHAIHFRCGDPLLEGLRVDVMSRMRGVSDFHELWKRRTTMSLDDGLQVDLLSLPDLVAAKKTQRDKDWPMIRALVDVNYHHFYHQPSPERVDFWLRELRTAKLLIQVASRFPTKAHALAATRPAVAVALSGDEDAVQGALDEEMARERAADREYWTPLKKELEQLRMSRGRDSFRGPGRPG